MSRKKYKITFKTNLDSATSEQKERFMKRLGEALGMLHKSVQERHRNQLLKSLEK